MNNTPSEWKDGFLFVANQLSLDFLNTKLVADGEDRELLPDIEAVVRWLAAASLIEPRSIHGTIAQWSRRPGVVGVLDRLKEFREQLRSVIFEWEAGKLPSKSFRANLNHLLSQHPAISELYPEGSQMRILRRFPLQVPEDSFGPLADAAASLFSEADPSRVRKCESCIVHFFDTSKKGSRRWCSMQICGNKHKVAAYAGRQRARQARQRRPAV